MREQKILLLSLLRERKHIYTIFVLKNAHFSGLCKVLCLLHLCLSPLHFSALITFSPYCNQPNQTLSAQHDISANSYPDTFTLTHWLVKGPRPRSRVQTTAADTGTLLCVMEGMFEPYLCIKHPKNRKALPREHLICCQGVKMLLLKTPFKVGICHISSCHNLSF